MFLRLDIFAVEIFIRIPNEILNKRLDFTLKSNLLSLFQMQCVTLKFLIRCDLLTYISVGLLFRGFMRNIWIKIHLNKIFAMLNYRFGCTISLFDRLHSGILHFYAGLVKCCNLTYLSQLISFVILFQVSETVENGTSKASPCEIEVNIFIIWLNVVH